MTPSPHGPYDLGCTRGTMASTMGQSRKAKINPTKAGLSSD